ncbi:peptidase M48 Ste24p [Thermodesulfobacterium geofontis OPF15]|uniref:Peptidase M48 Ste24p n=1 Tax=Thermodesulfobacterium geofontis (strain OPF15) TaxID=795359 RepID=F8C3C5_THEGP|nr:M48 family metallopeptidase [Thermodesulfobacterium geofontis]AEH23552.1 peptidase M48 Ste24p [Thermodesulfobacterium geofontis OPF15]
MIYEDLIYLWLAFIIYEFIPVTSYKISSIFLVSLFIFKEFLFIFLLLIVRKKIYQSHFINFLDKIFIGLSFIFYIIDLSFLSFKTYLDKIYFSSLIGILWFLHYMFLVRFLLLRFTLNYLKILLGIILPVLLLVIFQDIFNIFNLNFEGEFFLFLIIIIIISPFLIIKIWPVKPLDNLALREIILNFLKKNKVKISEIYVLDDLGKKLYTAGIIGFLPPFKYLFFSKPLLSILSPEEILGVVAHEIGHLKKRHNFWLLLLLLNLPLFLLTLLILSFLIAYYFSPQLIDIIKNKKTLPVSLEISLGIGLIFLAFIYIRYIFSFFLRQFEREADFLSAIILKSPQPIISALFKIGEVTGQLYRKSWHHYGIFERIEFLKNALINEEIFNKIQKKFLRIRIILLLWIILNLALILVILYLENIIKELNLLLSCVI